MNDSSKSLVWSYSHLNFLFSLFKGNILQRRKKTKFMNSSSLLCSLYLLPSFFPEYTLCSNLFPLHFTTPLLRSGVLQGVGNHTSREKIKSCYWGDLKEAKVVRNHRGTFREQQAVGWAQVQMKGSGGERRRRVRELCYGLWIQPQGQREGTVCKEEQPDPSWAFPSWLWGRKRVSGSSSEATLKAILAYGQEGKAGTRGLPWGSRNHTSQLSFLGEKTIIQRSN